MQAGAWEAVARGALEGADALAPAHALAHLHVGADRLVGRTHVAVVHDHDAATGEHPSEGDRAAEGRADRLARAAEQVHARWPAPQARSGGANPDTTSARGASGHAPR